MDLSNVKFMERTKPKKFPKSVLNVSNGGATNKSRYIEQW